MIDLGFINSLLPVDLENNVLFMVIRTVAGLRTNYNVPNMPVSFRSLS